MVKYVIHPEQLITAIADAIRSKKGSSTGYSITEMPEAIASIESGDLETQIIDSKFSTASTNPVQNKVVTDAIIVLNNALIGLQNRITFSSTDTYNSGSAELATGNIAIIYENTNE